MAKLSKRARAIREGFDSDKLYSLDEAIALVKKTATAKFDESIDLAVNLGIDPRKSDQAVRGAVVLPNGTGRATRVAVFTQGANVELAKEAGADLVGLEDLAQEVKSGQINFDVLVISGCSTLDRSGNPKIINRGLPILNIDHQPYNTLFGQVNVVEPDKSSVAELVYDLFKFANWRISPDIATCLLTGIFTDTGSFMHSNTKESTLRAAAELMHKGARPATVAKHTYKGKSVAGLKAWGKALENAYYDPVRKIIYSVITAQELEDLGNPPQGSFEGLVETLNKVPEAQYALFLKQEGDTIKGSLRSDPHKGVDVKKIASLFGGGGHMWASGFSVAGKLVRNEQGKWQVVG